MNVSYYHLALNSEWTGQMDLPWGGMGSRGERTYYEYLPTVCWQLCYKLSHLILTTTTYFVTMGIPTSSGNFPIVLELTTMADSWLLAQGTRSPREIAPREDNHTSQVCLGWSQLIPDVLAQLFITLHSLSYSEVSKFEQ